MGCGKIRVIVGSKSAIKVTAVEAAAAELGLEAEVVGIETDSRVAAQPFGLQETLNGALARALAAQDADPSAYAVGIENGLLNERHAMVDVACLAVLTPEIDLVCLRSEAVHVPADLARAAWASGQSVTAGALEARRSGCDPADPHRVWSEGRTDRKTILTAAVREALSIALSKGETS